MKLIFQEICEYKKYIFNAFIALITYLSFLIYFKIIFSYNSFNFILLILYFLLFAFYNKYGVYYKNSDKKSQNTSCLLSIILSFILIIGSLVSSHVTETTGLIFNFHTIIYLFVGVLGFYLLLKNCICIILDILPNCFDNRQNMNKKNFLTIFVLLIICWLPYLFRFFPAIMTPDSYYSIHYVKNGILSDFHAFGHTWFFGLFYYLGMFLFNNMNIAVNFYIIVQMLICSLIFTYILKFLFDNGVKKIYIILVFLLFAFSPLFALYSITLWRDILFGMAFATLFIAIYNFVKNEYQFKVSIIIIYIISILVILFFRNNGIYVFLLFIPFFIFLVKSNRKYIVIVNFVIVILYFIVKGPVFNYLEVEKTTSVEAFSIPLQQISRVIVNDGEIDQPSYDYLNEILDIQKVKDSYDPTISDFVKRASDNKKISNDKIKFLTTWFNIGFKNPRLYFEGYLCSTLGYWYPDVIYWATAGESSSIFNDINVFSKPLGPSFLKKTDVLISRKIPLSSILWSIGTMFIILVVSTFLLIYRSKSKFLIAYIPLYCLWFTYMLATPVFSELRYVYGLFVCMPLLVFAPFLNVVRK